MTEEIMTQEDYFKDEPIYLRKVIEELKQEKAVLQAYKDVNEDFKKAWEEIKDKYFDYKQALEEIRNCINIYCTVDNDFINSETYLRIKDELEVLGNEKM